MTFKEFARFKRIEAELSQQRCAYGLGMNDRSAFLKLESEKYPHQWSLNNLIDFAFLLKVRPYELLAEFEASHHAGITK